MKHLSWIITVPVAVVVIIFAISNRQGVAIDLWPFEIRFELPLFLLALGCILVGYFIGAAAMWVSEGRVRRRGPGLCPRPS